MTTAAVSLPQPSPLGGTSDRSRRRGTVALIALLLVGTALVWAGAVQRREDGFFTTAAAPLSTPTSALVTSEIDVGARRPADPSFDVGDLGRVRIRAGGTRPAEPIFVGIGPSRQVEDYLRGSGYDEMSSYEVDPLRVSYGRSPGSGRPSPPTAQHFWVASTVGSGTQDLQWDKRGGAWTAVAMRADGHPGVDITADVGLRFAFLLPLGATTLAIGLLLLIATVTAGSGRLQRACARARPLGRAV